MFNFFQGFISIKWIAKGDEKIIGTSDLSSSLIIMMEEVEIRIEDHRMNPVMPSVTESAVSDYTPSFCSRNMSIRHKLISKGNFLKS